MKQILLKTANKDCKTSIIVNRGGKPVRSVNRKKIFLSQKFSFYSSDISGLIQDRFKKRTGCINRFTDRTGFPPLIVNLLESNLDDKIKRVTETDSLFYYYILKKATFGRNASIYNL
ncbi:hypothetical protein BpHYR1_012290 [Brachionus plicatilis]|uniref:Uncharacterized protein n=1 Tax=Brachionus plicatilis TaxID=10195 RepID=A0A3M7PUP1_BRAPC|nr:hypothetical protein BpHYR1_012290 [Brachionus plicatilis]